MSEPWWWLSFADGNRPVGEQFIGGCWIQGYTMQAVLLEASVNGLNPGGEVQVSGPCPRSFEVPERWANRVLTLPEIAQMNSELA